MNQKVFLFLIILTIKGDLLRKNTNQAKNRELFEQKYNVHSSFTDEMQNTNNNLRELHINT